MKNEILPILSASCLLCLLNTPTQGTLVVSNLEQTPVGNAAIGADSWIAQAFFFRASAANLYRLDSVQLRMNSANGVASNFEVSLYSAPVGAGVAAPEEFLGPLDGPSEPSTSGLYSYTSTGIELSGNILYFVVATSSTPTAQGAYNWSVTDGAAQNGVWVVPSNWNYSSSDGLTWEPHLQEGAFQMAIYATVVPEPTTGVLLGLGLGIVVIMRMSPPRDGRRRLRWSF